MDLQELLEIEKGLCEVCLGSGEVLLKKSFNKPELIIKCPCCSLPNKEEFRRWKATQQRNVDEYFQEEYYDE